jgi:hypothetical protein
MIFSLRPLWAEKSLPERKNAIINKIKKQAEPGGLPVVETWLWAYFLMAALSLAPARKTGTLVAGIVIMAPVRGLRPARAFRLLMVNVPNPEKLTLFPFLSWTVTPAINACRATPACRLDIPDSRDMIAIISSLVMA